MFLPSLLLLLLLPSPTPPLLRPPVPRPSLVLRSGPPSPPSDSAWSNVCPLQKTSLFGRLADKNILLDPSGGSCCYSGCADCEYRDPETGGYRMPEMTAARPKWIVPYWRRTFGSKGGVKDHEASWSAVFGGGEEGG